MIQHLLLTFACPHCGGKRIQTIVWHGNIAAIVVNTCVVCDAPARKEESA